MDRQKDDFIIDFLHRMRKISGIQPIPLSPSEAAVILPAIKQALSSSKPAPKPPQVTTDAPPPESAKPRSTTRPVKKQPLDLKTAGYIAAYKAAYMRNK
ncbi:MAG: hypothetical protein HQL52_05920 [Magnetococcales bacterium]|nr:hypothetical protein [Magnetococcales bacterium]